MFLGKSVLKMCSKFTGEHTCRSAISIKLQRNFTEITRQHGCSPVNMLHIFRTPFTKSTSKWLLLQKSTFSLENNKCICQGNFLFTTQLDLLTAELFLEVYISQGYIQNFERNWKNSTFVRVNKFTKSVNF